MIVPDTLLSSKWESHVSINSLQVFKAAPSSNHSTIFCLLYSVEAQKTVEIQLWDDVSQGDFPECELHGKPKRESVVAAAPGGNNPAFLAHLTCLRTVVGFVTYTHTGKTVSFDWCCSKLGSVMSYRKMLNFTFSLGLLIEW